MPVCQSNVTDLFHHKSSKAVRNDDSGNLSDEDQLEIAQVSRLSGLPGYGEEH